MAWVTCYENIVTQGGTVVQVNQTIATNVFERFDGAMANDYPSCLSRAAQPLSLTAVAYLAKMIRNQQTGQKEY